MVFEKAKNLLRDKTKFEWKPKHKNYISNCFVFQSCTKIWHKNLCHTIKKGFFRFFLLFQTRNPYDCLFIHKKKPQKKMFSNNINFFLCFHFIVLFIDLEILFFFPSLNQTFGFITLDEKHRKMDLLAH